MFPLIYYYYLGTSVKGARTHEQAHTRKKMMPTQFRRPKEDNLSYHQT